MGLYIFYLYTSLSFVSCLTHHASRSIHHSFIRMSLLLNLPVLSFFDLFAVLCTVYLNRTQRVSFLSRMNKLLTKAKNTMPIMKAKPLLVAQP